MSRTRQVVVLGAVILVLLMAAGLGWWRVVSLNKEIDAADSEASVQNANASHLTDELERTRDDLLRTEEGLRRAQQQLRGAQAEARDMQDCVGLMADEDDAGHQTVVFGFVKLGAARQLLVDEAEWFFGEEAHRARREDHAPEQLDYYIRNDDSSLAPFAVAKDVIVVTTTGDRHNIPAPKCRTWQEFASRVARPQRWEASLKRSPYWVTVRSGEVIRLVEQYLP